MGKSFNDYLALRRSQILLQLQSITNELTLIVKLEEKLSVDNEDIFSGGHEDIQPITEAEVIDIMKSEKRPWSKRQLINVSRERNPDLRGFTYPMLGEIISIILNNPQFKTVRPGYWELTDEAEAFAKEEGRS